MFKTLDVLTKRYLQITTAIMLFVVVEQFLHIPHSIWIVITGATIYAGFNPGTVLKRSYLRFTGTVTGVCAMALMWHVIHWDYRTAVIFAVLICWAMVFFIALPYNVYMIVVTLSSDIAVEWSNSGHFTLQFYVVDRLMCTLIVYAICLVMEHLWFGRSSFTDLNYARIKEELHNEMKSTVQLVDSQHLSKAKLLRFVRSTRRKMDLITVLVNDAQFERNTQIRNDDFPARMVLLFRQVVSVWYVQKRDPENPVLPELRRKAHKSFDSI